MPNVRCPMSNAQPPMSPLIILLRSLLVLSLVLPASLPYLLRRPELSGLGNYTPRGLIHSHSIGPLLLSPWSIPSTVPVTISHLTQAVLFSILPSEAIPCSYAFGIVLALSRAAVGFIMTRSVGWVWPALFSHWALYEPCSAFGPGLLVWLAWRGGTGSGSGTDRTSASTVPVTVKGTRWNVSYVPLLGCGLFLLENRRWTYGGALGLHWIGRIGGRWWVRSTSSLPSPLPSTEVRSPAASTRNRNRNRMTGLITALALVTFHLNLFPASTPRLPLPPSSPSAPSAPPSPLLQILILSYPRPPNTTTSISLLTQTLDSFLPFQSDQIHLSVFTHARDHPAFDHVSKAFRPLGVTFGGEGDEHEGQEDGHYLHLAEAFRWVQEGMVVSSDLGEMNTNMATTARARARAEWIMLVEDDFPVCAGERGWEVIRTVMARLERDRRRGWIGSGFVGTGGSGLIMHHTYLPLLRRILHTYSSSPTPLPPNTRRSAPDVVVQDCLLGPPGSLCERVKPDVPTLLSFPLPVSGSEPRRPRMIVSSRLVLDHIGGMATTTLGKTLNEDRWRCGWRHPFHGMDGVGVVVV